MTNQDSTQFTDFSWLTSLSPLGATFVFVLFICYFARRLKQVPTYYVFPLTVLGIVVGVILQPIKHPDQISDLQWMFFRIVFSTVVSIAGTLISWAAHDKGFVWLASKFPAFGFLVSDDINPNKP